MLGTLFYPMGRIGPATFRNAALVLIAAGACISIMPALAPALWALSFLSFVMLYPWVVIWVKRLHDAGKSGWWFLAILAAMIAASATANHFITARFTPAPPVPGSGPIDIAAVMKAQVVAGALPGTIIGVVISLAFALIINEELKSQPGENAYGEPPAG
jgi:uncharacterized membrane protein YhaH (DUF805 family)